jgi:hypothetical protein
MQDGSARSEQSLFTPQLHQRAFEDQVKLAPRLSAVGTVVVREVREHEDDIARVDVLLKPVHVPVMCLAVH